MTFDAHWRATTQPVAASVGLADGRRLEYAARWHELDLRDAAGGAVATVSATSYTTGGSGRPVTFLWNGGPGASSSPLHTRAFGPRTLQDGVFTDNPHTLLPHTDLVFVDPPGTGFSRVLVDAPHEILSPLGDARAVETLIRAWLTEHARTGDTVHLVGESYGGYRLALLAEHVHDLSIGALVLVSPLLDPTAASEGPANDLPYVFALPSMAAAAAFHGRSAIDEPLTAWRTAHAIAADTLLPLLHRGSEAPAAQVRTVAAELAGLIGIEVEALVDAGLRLESEAFLRLLRADDELVVGRLDTRVTGPVLPPHPDGRPEAADDPALGLGRGGNVIRSAPIASYLRDELGAPGEEYVSLSLDLNFAFDWASTWGPREFAHSRVDRIRGLLEARPQARVLLVGGIFDLATPLAASVWAVAHGIPGDRVDVVTLRGGHSLDADTLPVAHDAIVQALNGAS